MSRTQIPILGHHGQVGWEPARTLAPLGGVAARDDPDVDLADPESLRALMRGLRPTLIGNAAAHTAVDQAESDADTCMASNRRAPAVLAEEAARLGALPVHDSTGCAFDGTKRSPSVETDPANPPGVYGRAKPAGDEAVRQSGCVHSPLLP